MYQPSTVMGYGSVQDYVMSAVKKGHLHRTEGIVVRGNGSPNNIKFNYRGGTYERGLL